MSDACLVRPLHSHVSVELSGPTPAKASDRYRRKWSSEARPRSFETQARRPPAAPSSTEMLEIGLKPEAGPIELVVFMDLVRPRVQIAVQCDPVAVFEQQVDLRQVFPPSRSWRRSQVVFAKLGERLRQHLHSGT